MLNPFNKSFCPESWLFTIWKIFNFCKEMGKIIVLKRGNFRTSSKSFRRRTLLFGKFKFNLENLKIGSYLEKKIIKMFVQWFQMCW